MCLGPGGQGWRCTEAKRWSSAPDQATEKRRPCANEPCTRHGKRGVDFTTAGHEIRDNLDLLNDACVGLRRRGEKRG